MDLIQRRLLTLVRMLQEGALAKGAKYDLTPKEMLDWATQCQNIADARNPIDPLLR